MDAYTRFKSNYIDIAMTLQLQRQMESYVQYPMFFKIFGPAGVAEVGSLPASAKMAIQIFVRCIFAIFATNAPFLRIIPNLQI